MHVSGVEAPLPASGALTCPTCTLAGLILQFLLASDTVEHHPSQKALPQYSSLPARLVPRIFCTDLSNSKASPSAAVAGQSTHIPGSLMCSKSQYVTSTNTTYRWFLQSRHQKNPALSLEASLASRQRPWRALAQALGSEPAWSNLLGLLLTQYRVQSVELPAADTSTSLTSATWSTPTPTELVLRQHAPRTRTSLAWLAAC